MRDNFTNFVPGAGTAAANSASKSSNAWVCILQSRDTGFSLDADYVETMPCGAFAIGRWSGCSQQSALDCADVCSRSSSQSKPRSILQWSLLTMLSGLLLVYPPSRRFRTIACARQLHKFCSRSRKGIVAKGRAVAAGREKRIKGK